MMTAGRSFAVSPPTPPENLIHQTSARFIGDVSAGGLYPLQRFGLACFVFGHLLVGAVHVVAEHVGPNEPLDELADPSAANDIVQAVINSLVESDSQFLLHPEPRNTCRNTYCSQPETPCNAPAPLPQCTLSRPCSLGTTS